MKIKIINEVYKPAPANPDAWMIRRNGETIPVLIHPTGENYGDIESIYATLEAAQWLYDYTEKPKSRNDVIKFISSYAEKYKSPEESRVKFLLKQISSKALKSLSKEFVNKIKSEIESSEIGDVDEYNLIIIQDLNNEFLRAHFGGIQNRSVGSREISFRVSSDGSINWFDVIYMFVHNNKNKLGIKSVTIVTDLEATGHEDFYSYKGQVFNQMPVDEFLSLSGNPVVEELNEDIDAEDVMEAREKLMAIKKKYTEAEDVFNSIIKQISDKYDNKWPDEAIQELASEEKRLHIPELKKEFEDSNEQFQNLNKEFNKQLVDKEIEDEKKAIEKSGLSSPDYFRNLAKKEFKQTSNFKVAGYLLPDGTMLSLGDNGNVRGQDHRAIGVIYANYQGSEALIKFMSDGNIRLMPETPGVDIDSKIEPTSSQYAKIKDMIWSLGKRKGYFSIDFTDTSSSYGNVVGSLSYEDNINPTKIINDIKKFYATGEIADNEDDLSLFYGESLNIDEKYAYHYGDLNVAKKADRRAIMGGRGTGHFGTGFYMVGFYDPKKSFDYGKRACWEIDLDKYNLFKPKSNAEAYHLHDALKELNSWDGKDPEIPSLDVIQMEIDEIVEKYLTVTFEDIENYYHVDSDKAYDMWLKDEYDEDKFITPDKKKKAEEEIIKLLNEYGFGWYAEHKGIDIERLGILEDDLRRMIDDAKYDRELLSWAINTLNSIFGKDVENIARKACSSPDQEDSKSTVFMKLLGYEGIDVTHLNKDGGGLRGPDNFTYGSVIYDLKPGTYRQVKEKDEK